MNEKRTERPDLRLQDRVALVTGGGSGIGAGICRAFAAEGARVAVTDLDLEAAERAAAEIREQGGTARAWQLDVTRQEAVERCADRVEEELGNLEIWMNNAGISKIVPFLECDDRLWELTLRINLTGTFFGCQAAIRRMLPRGRGVVLNMSSQSGKIGNSQYAAYCASKFGIIGLTQSLAQEYAESGIRINALCPGMVFTPLWEIQQADYARKRRLDVEEVRPYLEKKVPLGRLGDVGEVAKVAVFLASDEAAYMTGQSININGGTVMN